MNEPHVIKTEEVKTLLRSHQLRDGFGVDRVRVAWLTIVSAALGQEHTRYHSRDLYCIRDRRWHCFLLIHQVVAILGGTFRPYTASSQKRDVRV